VVSFKSGFKAFFHISLYNHANLLDNYKTSFRSSISKLFSAATPGDVESQSNVPKKLQKIEAIKLDSNYLRYPLEDEMKTEEIFVNPDAGNL
jgi:hypothetical protein